tara:strand:+ start:1654 stop:1956 length:303 start_codon:yes stop_codon:yes gene_type:complete
MTEERNNSWNPFPIFNNPRGGATLGAILSLVAVSTTIIKNPDHAPKTLEDVLIYGAIVATTTAAYSGAGYITQRVLEPGRQYISNYLSRWSEKYDRLPPD